MNRKAFTLIELLVVVAVLALLASIVFSNLGGAREGARISNALSFQSQTHSLLGSDLVGWWNFNEGSGTTARDISGYNNNGTIVGATYTDGVPGTGGSALSFNGVGDYVDMGNILNMGLNDMTISAWIKINNIGGYYISKSRAAGQTHRYAINVYGSSPNEGKIRPMVAWDSTGHTDYFGNTRVDDGNWHLIDVAINRSGNLDIYVDGVMDASHDISDKAGVNMISDNPFRIGAYTAIDNVTPSSLFNGPIDDVRIYSRALTASEIQTLYAQTKDNYLANE